MHVFQQLLIAITSQIAGFLIALICAKLEALHF